jgi:hypothetical protein
MEHEEMASTRSLSKKLFGALYRLEVIAFIEPGEAFNLKELSQRMGTPPGLSSLQKELKLLTAVGMLFEQPPVGGMREVYYVAQPSSLWRAARDLCAQDPIGDDSERLASGQRKKS